MADSYSLERVNEIVTMLNRKDARMHNVEMTEGGGLALTQNFSTGATRSADEHKYDFEGFLSPEVLERFGAYMHKHRKQRDGRLRDSDNWQKGIPIHKYMKSLVRHTFDLWRAYRGKAVVDKDTGEFVTMTDLLMAILFNVQGMTLELLRRNGDSIYYVCDETRAAISEDRPFSFLCPLQPTVLVTPKAEPGQVIPYPAKRDMARRLYEPHQPSAVDEHRIGY